MVNIGSFNPDAHEPRQSFDPLPAGWYAMQITESEMVTTKNGRGQYLQLTLEVMESQHPEFKGRFVWDRLNLINDNQIAVDIANGTLSSICKAVGHLGELTDSKQLHHKPLAVKLKVSKETEDYDASNDVKGYDAGASRFGGAQATQPMAAPGTAQQAASAPQAQAGAAAPPPWLTKN